jgi:hypothetical protein
MIGYNTCNGTIKTIRIDSSDSNLVTGSCSFEAKEEESQVIPLRWILPLPYKIKVKCKQLLIEDLLECKNDLERYSLTNDPEKLARTIIKSWLLIKEIDTGFPILTATLELDESERSSDNIIRDRVKNLIVDINDIFETSKNNYGIDLISLKG